MRHKISTPSRAEPCKTIIAQVHLPLAGQAGAVEGEAVQGTKSSYGDLLGTEKFTGDRLDLFAGHRLDAGEDFVERIEAAEVEFLAREVGHARTGGLER